MRRAVRRTFFDLFQKDLVYRGKRLVNWDTFLQTAVSDDEVFHETVQGNFWHFQYPVIDPEPGEPTRITIATTRPETMLGDTAVAVHPDPAQALRQAESDLRERLAEAGDKDRGALASQLADLAERKQTLLPRLEQLRDMAKAGRRLRLPLVDREIPLVADSWAKPELGSGCVKITPAHDTNDYEVGLRCHLPMVNILNPDGTLNAQAGPYQGLTIAAARKRVVADLEELGLLGEIEDREIELAHSDRSKTPIEPYLADQWFVRMDELAQSAMDAVSDGRVRMIPPRYAKGYHDWLSEKRDWPVSRQLWWGHQIPIWSRACATSKECDACCADLAALPGSTAGDIVYSVEYPQSQDTDGLFATIHACVKEEAPDLEDMVEQLGFVREQDVLDTWFSSALWPHSTLGWPEQTPELSYFYPTSTLITSRDIITLWVARMVLMGLNNMGEVPFREVFIHPKILDGHGETMSKSKGNGVDPLDVIQKFGADALRFGLAYLTTDTQDVRMPVQFECPHCDTLVDQTVKNRQLPVIECKNCKKPFSTQWAAGTEYADVPRGAVVSERFELARNFGNKLWNASRFALMNLQGFTAGPVPDAELAIEDRWILSRLATVTQQVTDSLDAYRYSEAARAVYDFAWDEFCSFYVEMAKERFTGDSATVARRVLAHTLDTLLRLLHPMIPFITEEVWQMLGQVAPERGLPRPQEATKHLMAAAWPVANTQAQDPQIERQFARFQAVLGALREIRSRQGIAPRQSIEFCVRCDAETRALLQPMEAYFESMARATNVGWGSDVSPPATSAAVNLPGMEVFVDLKDFIDVDAERSRLQKEVERLTRSIAGREAKLANRNFVERAPADVVEKERQTLQAMREQLSSAQSALDELGPSS